MRVGFVVVDDLDATSGGFYYDRRLRERLMARGHEVTVVSIPWRGYGRHLLDNLRPVEQRLDGFDLLIEDGLAHPSLLVANRRVESPAVALVHMLRTEASGGTARPLVCGVERQFIAGVDAAIYNSEATRSAAATLAAPPECAVVPPGCDRFDPDVTSAYIRGRAGSGPLEVTFLGNAVERKGLDTLVEGLSRLDLDWRLTVVGATDVEPAYVRTVRRQIRTAGVADRAGFTGRLPEAVVAARLRATDVLAIPSRYEPFGMSYLEAMGFGCVPLATRNGGPPEFVDDGTSGLLVPPDCPQTIADRLATLGDRDRLADMGLAARRRFERHPSWNVTLDRAVDFLEARYDGC